MAALALTAMIGFGVAWMEAGLPRLAFYHEIASVEKFAVGTRQLILLEKRKQASFQLDLINVKLEADPNNRDLRRERNNLREELKLIEQQLEELKDAQPE